LYRCKFYDENKQLSVNLASADKEGCPIKIIIGSREFESKNLTISLRFSPKEKNVISNEEIFSFIVDSEKKISNYLYEKSDFVKKSHVFKFDNYCDFIKEIEYKKGLFLVPFCDRSSCENSVREKFPSFSFRCISFSEEILNNKCIFCQFDSVGMAYFGRSY